MTRGKWFRVDAGKKYPIEILVEANDGVFGAFILIEDRNPEQPYKLTIMNELYPMDPPSYVYPPFALMKGLPIPAVKKEDLTSQKIPVNWPAEKREMEAKLQCPRMHTRAPHLPRGQVMMRMPSREKA